MKAFFIMAVLAVSALSTAQETFNLKAFTALKVQSNIQVTLVKSSENKLVVDEGDTTQLVIDNEGNSLDLGLKQPQTKKSKTIKGTLYYNSSLSSIATGAGSKLMSTDVVKSQSLELNTGSGSYMELNVDAATLAIEVSSGGAMKLEGNAGTQTVKVNSGAVLKAKDLVSTNAEVKVTSGGVGAINVTGTLDGKATSGSSLSVYGNPKTVNKHNSTGGSISVK